MGSKIGLKYLISHKHGPYLGNMYTSLCLLIISKSHYVRFKVKEYEQIRYVLWAAIVGRWSKGQIKFEATTVKDS